MPEIAPKPKAEAKPKVAKPKAEKPKSDKPKSKKPQSAKSLKAGAKKTAAKKSKKQGVRDAEAYAPGRRRQRQAGQDRRRARRPAFHPCDDEENHSPFEEISCA